MRSVRILSTLALGCQTLEAAWSISDIESKIKISLGKSCFLSGKWDVHAPIVFN